MKSIFTLLLGLVITVGAFAADRRPSVTINSSKNYQIIIDGKTYYSNGSFITLDNLRFGEHNLKVIQAGRGFRGKRARLVSASDLRLGANDVQINVDRFGSVQINEIRDRGHDRRSDWRKDNDRDRQ